MWSAQQRMSKFRSVSFVENGSQEMKVRTTSSFFFYFKCWIQALVCVEIAFACMENDEYGAAQEQLRLALKALDWKSKIPNEQQSHLVAEVLMHLGFTLDSLEQHDQAYTHLQKSHSIFEANVSQAAAAGDKQLEISLRSHLASVLNNLSVWHFNASKRSRDSKNAQLRLQFTELLNKARLMQEDCVAFRKELGQEDTANMAQALYHLGSIFSLSEHRRAALDHTHRSRTSSHASNRICCPPLCHSVIRDSRRALEIRKRILGSEHPLTMKAYVSMASLMCVEQRDYKQSFEYAKIVYLVRLRLFPADSKEIREVESAVFEYALLLLLAYARAGEQSSVVKKVAMWSIEAAQKGLLDCGKKPTAQRVAPAASRNSGAVFLERSMRGDSRTKELQVPNLQLASARWRTRSPFVAAVMPSQPFRTTCFNT
jgi:tetratricopeptide (TPR) repeat protein